MTNPYSMSYTQYKIHHGPEPQTHKYLWWSLSLITHEIKEILIQTHSFYTPFYTLTQSTNKLLKYKHTLNHVTRQQIYILLNNENEGKTGMKMRESENPK